jgi:hypothetical protein
MNPHVFALSEELTVGEAITELQSNRRRSRWCSISTWSTNAVILSASCLCDACCSSRRRHRSSGS